MQGFIHPYSLDYRLTNLSLHDPFIMSLLY
jgi:hypothetical protein